MLLQLVPSEYAREGEHFSTLNIYVALIEICCEVEVSVHLPRPPKLTLNHQPCRLGLTGDISAWSSQACSCEQMIGYSRVSNTDKYPSLEDAVH